MSDFTPHLAALAPRLDAAPGTVSVYCAPLDGPPRYARLADAPHYAASTMKVAVMAAAYRLADAGTLDLDAEVPVHAEFASALAGGPRFTMNQDYDQDDEVWARLGGTAPLRWLTRRMIVRSCNLATNLVLEATGVPAAAAVLADTGATGSTLGRGIEDAPAREAGIDNLVTAADLSRQLTAIAAGRDSGVLASPESCREMIDVLLAQEHTGDLADGLPPGTRIAHKNGWVEGIRHGTGVVLPDDAPPYVLTVCTSGPLPDEDACRLLADIAAASWADRSAP